MDVLPFADHRRACIVNKLNCGPPNYAFTILARKCRRFFLHIFKCDVGQQTSFSRTHTVGGYRFYYCLFGLDWTIWLRQFNFMGEPWANPGGYLKHCPYLVLTVEFTCEQQQRSAVAIVLIGNTIVNNPVTLAANLLLYCNDTEQYELMLTQAGWGFPESQVGHGLVMHQDVHLLLLYRNWSNIRISAFSLAPHNDDRSTNTHTFVRHLIGLHTALSYHAIHINSVQCSLFLKRSKLLVINLTKKLIDLYEFFCFLF